MFKNLSIRARLTAWNVLALAIILTTFSATAYWYARRALLHTLENTLEMQADAVADSYDPEEGRFEILHSDELEADEALSSWIRIVKSDGHVFYETPALRAAGWPFPLEQARQLSDRSKRLLQSRTAPNGARFREIVYPIWHGSTLVGWVQLALPLEQVSEPLGRLLRSLLLAAPLALLLAAFSGYWLAGRALRPVELIRSRAQEISQANLSSRVPVENPHDELGRLARTFNEMLDRLQEAFESQRRFMADASHELKTPLSVLRARWEREIENAELPRSLRERLVRDVEELARLNKLVEDLLLLTRADGGKIVLNRETVELKRVLESVLEDARTLAGEKKQKLEADLDERAAVRGDSGRLHQLFLNLLDNAVKYSPPGARVRLSCRREDNSVVVEVSDDGQGIPPEDLPRIFDRFYRVDKSRSRELGGSGLGLSICKWIAEAHGGSISIESAPGQGTTVTVRLPAEG